MSRCNNIWSGWWWWWCILSFKIGDPDVTYQTNQTSAPQVYPSSLSRVINPLSSCINKVMLVILIKAVQEFILVNTKGLTQCGINKNKVDKQRKLTLQEI